MKIGLAGPQDVTAYSDVVEDSSSLQRGYSFPFTSQLALSYWRAGHHVVAFALDSELDRPRTWTGDRFTLHVLPLRRRVRHRARDAFRQERAHLMSAMAAENCDVIHAHWTYEFALAALRSGTPTVITVHDWAPAILNQSRDAYRALRLLMQTVVLLRARYLTAPSPYIKERVKRVFRKDPVLVPNGLPASWFTSGHTRSSDEFLVGCANPDFGRRKNVTTMLEAFARVRLQVPAARLRLCGPDYEQGGPAAAWAESRGLAAGVDFVGAVAQELMPGFFDGLDVFVHPSLEESFGMVVLEAMARGVPVVGGAQSGAVPWLLKQGSGFVTDVRDPGVLAESIVRARAKVSRAERERLAEHLKARFSVDACAEEFMDILSLCAGRASRGPAKS